MLFETNSIVRHHARASSIFNSRRITCNSHLFLRLFFSRLKTHDTKLTHARLTTPNSEFPTPRSRLIIHNSNSQLITHDSQSPLTTNGTSPPPAAISPLFHDRSSSGSSSGTLPEVATLLVILPVPLHCRTPIYVYPLPSPDVIPCYHPAGAVPAFPNFYQYAMQSDAIHG